MSPATTFIIPSIGRPTHDRAINSTRGLDCTFLTEIDDKRTGPGLTRNRLIKQATTDWISFLDDDDTVTQEYVDRLKEEVLSHPDADVIHFREYFINIGHILPTWPEVAWGNVGISFSMKRQVALDNPFLAEPYEDFELLRRLDEKGYTIFFSKYLVYHVRH